MPPNYRTTTFHLSNTYKKMFRHWSNHANTVIFQLAKKAFQAIYHAIHQHCPALSSPSHMHRAFPILAQHLTLTPACWLALVPWELWLPRSSRDCHLCFRTFVKFDPYISISCVAVDKIKQIDTPYVWWFSIRVRMLCFHAPFPASATALESSHQVPK